VERISAFGPRRTGPNLFIDATAHGICNKFLRETTENGQQMKDEPSKPRGDIVTAEDFTDKITYAFQLATAQGPLCNEPMQGVAVFLEDVTVAVPSDEDSTAREKMGRLTGEVIRTVRQSIYQGFLDWSPRMLLAMYSCEIQASSKSAFFPTYNFYGSSLLT
jgi:ribosome assembly protein 1